MKKCIWYVRVSTSSQDYARQKTPMIELAKSKKFKLINIFEDKISWAKVKYEQRVWFSKLKNFLIDNKDVKIVLIDELSRLWRNVKETSITISFFKENNIKIFLWDKEFDLDREDNELLFNILSSLSQYELTQIRNRSISWKKEVLRNWWTIFWARPFGFDLIKVKKEDKTWKIKARQNIIINEEEAKHIRKMFNLIWRKKQTIHYVYAYLKSKNVIGIKWKEEFSKSSIKKILKNKLYCWEWEYKFKWETIFFNVKKIVSRKLYDATQSQLSENYNSKVNKDHLESFLLKSIIYTKVEEKDKLTSKMVLKLKPLQTHFENKNNEKVRQYRHPSRNTTSPIDKSILSTNDSLITVLNSIYIEKVILHYLWFILINSDFFEDYNMKELQKLWNINRIDELEKEIEKLNKKLIDNENLSFKTQEAIDSLELDLQNKDFSDNSERTLNRNLKEAQRLKKHYNKNLDIIEDEIDSKNKELDRLILEKEKYEGFKNIAKQLKFIKNREFKDLVSIKEILKTREKLLEYISKVEINDNKEKTQEFHSFIWDLKKYWIYKEWNKLLKMIYHSVYNRNKKPTLIKSNAYALDIIFHFSNWVSHKLTIVYNHKDPYLYFPPNYEQLIKEFGWDEKSQNDYRLIFEWFQSFNINTKK